MSKLKFVFFASLAIATLIGCTKEDDTKGSLNLSITGLKDLGSDYAYEGWLIVNGSPVSAGIFTVDESGNLSQTSFEISQSDLDDASAYVLTIEPSPDNDPGPSSVHILGGDFSNNSATITVGHGSALGDDFSTSMGKYILATPTDGSNSNENSGVWWLDPASGPGLDLPVLPTGWKYEGWAVIGGTPVSTGKFLSVNDSDEDNTFSGTMSAPNFPGEDFLMNAPSGLTFPTDLSGTTVVISIEPEPDNSLEPFLLKPLVGNVPDNAVDHTLYEMNNNASATNPTGIVTK